ncbi:nucleoid occlusion protein [Erysipelothrix tonsillarum]|uniref:nucleoid occlusion protein n=1 Tax=Erysipelothrix tonsillarum TaxID=38402 RepID=UPI00037E0D82|nr:nucleoid occlusion protein [Erysipelothrix tonsillarum]
MIDRREIAIEKIKPNRNQPRLTFNDESLLELGQSISENGLLQPIVVREVNETDEYEIIAGERRYRAMRMFGFTEVPCIISNIDDNKSATLALIENIQREDLSVLEEAKAYRDLLRIQKITQKELATKVGKSQSAIANKIRLLELPEPVLEALGERKITERHARALLSVEKEKTEEVLDEILNKKLNVKETETLINKPRKKKVVTRGISQHIKIGINTIKQSIGMIEKTGITVKHDMEETDDEVIITVRFPK